MAAAAMAADHGLSVALIDERPNAGGQIYRGLEGGPFRHCAVLGSDYAHGLEIIARFRSAHVTALFGVILWRVDMTETGGVASYSKDGVPQRLAFRKLILATGAIERPVAFEGWTLPGVMGVGAAQLLLKSSAIAPSGRVVLAGSGPLMLLFATQLLAFNIEISAILDTAPKVDRIGAALGNVGGIFRNFEKMRKGLRMQRDIRGAGIPVHRNVSTLTARGGDCINSIVFETNGLQHETKVDTLLIHEGIVPNTQLSRALGCKHVWDEGQRCQRPELDEYGESTVAGVFIVGDSARVTGATAAPASADIAVGRILEQMDRANASSRATSRRAAATMARERAFRPFIDALYPPRISVSPVSDTTIVCRCEEVSAGAIRSAVKDGAVGPAQAKAFTRCGMGPCQGRMCGPVVSALIAGATDRTVADVGAYNVRFPLKPVTFAEMAQCGDGGNQEESHHAA
jgi:NADPH-dependent 2,4-dienoyl-CoA reductase/sulfur reductase-like enzyme